MSTAPVTEGTLIFIGAFSVIIIWFWALSGGNFISKDSFRIATVVTTTLGVATWLMWLCAWMHQWHPLITPTYKGEHTTETTGDSVGR